MTTGMSSAGVTRTGFDAAAIDALGVRVGGLAIDSRKVKPGDLFLAYPGQRTDGRAHIAQAIAAGASAVLWDNHADNRPLLFAASMRRHPSLRSSATNIARERAILCVRTAG